MNGKQAPASTPSLRKHNPTELGDAQAADYRSTTESDQANPQGEPPARQAGESKEKDS